MKGKMVTEEYLEKMENLTNVPKTRENYQKFSGPQNSKSSAEIEKIKEDLPFTKLGVYIHLLPIVIELLEEIDKAEKNNHTKLWWMLYEISVNSITELIVGYNNYHTEDKVEVYNKVRANISRIQALIIILSHLKQLEKEAEEKYCMQLEECIRATSSLIKTIEGRK